MPTLSNKPFSGYWQRLLQVNQNSNTGVDSTTRNIESGNGAKSAVNISDDQLIVQPQSDDTTSTVNIKTNDGTSIFTADTTNKKILAGQSQVAINTMYKEFGMFQLDVQAGYHSPLVCNNMLIGNDDDTNWSADESTFGNGADPALVLDLDADGTASNLVACLWYIEDNITIDACRFIATCKSADPTDLNFHLMSYTLDITTELGDLSAGEVVANGAAENTLIDELKVGTLSLIGTVDINAGKVVVCTVENVDNTTEPTVQVVVKYHIR